MNILVVCHYGLYQNLSFSFVHNQIREFVRMGHKVRVIIPNGVGKVGRDGKRIGKGLQTSQVDGVELFDLRYVTLSGYGDGGFNVRSAISAIRSHSRRIFKDFRPDVIHAHTLGFDSDIGAWLKNKFGCPLVVTTHGSDTAIPLQRGKVKELCAACDKADRIVAVSSALADSLRTCGTATPIEVIHNGFVPHNIPKNNSRLPLRMIQVGNLVPSKRVNVTIQAFSELIKRYSGMELYIVGQGAELDNLRQLCDSLGITEKVFFLGQLPNEEVFVELCKSTFFVMASKPEGFGIVYLEAMAAGCIAIGTEGQGIADVIRSGENGYLVPSDDYEAIVKIIDFCINNPDQASAIANNGREDALTLTWENNARKYTELFSSLSVMTLD